ncbi:hypothetical protein FQ185_07495 [Pseudomonas sp. ANT_H12B]|nr:hypothetical protein FQ185_07495 [Pseudomonas sp. ANT_H12B]
MSTLNEIAANHAKMAKALIEEPTALSEQPLQLVASFEVPSIDVQHMPLHLIVGAQDTPPRTNR